MSERSFFDWRTAVPGYTFVLLVLAFNYAPLIKILQSLGLDSIFGALLGFLTLFSGSAIGFLVSQVWWRHFQNNGAHYYYKNMVRKEIKRLVEKYGLRSAEEKLNKKYRLFTMIKKNEIERIQNVLAVYGFVTHHEMEKNPEIVKYTTRRGDVFHLISATRVVLLLGLSIGFLFRFLSQFFIFKWNLNQLFESIYNIPANLEHLSSNFMEVVPDLAGLEILFLSFLVVSALILFRFLGKGRDWINTQYDDMSYAIINKSGIRRWQLQKIFPQEYFDKNWVEP
ncbi:MAG TPA: hypothetical protein VMX17_09695 [Candidatus Glassbacteria bacterium]|nr:hypothetical protein [Candidatus Glassbacteria bacterium]